jgi:GrpB-like predicted nucleotidyltransferase (UPF0157 family)
VRRVSDSGGLGSDGGESDGDRHARLAAPHGDAGATVRLVESGSRHESLMRFRDALRADGSLLARWNAVRIEAAAGGGAAHARAKGRFIAEALAR